ncbi:MAG: DUF1269 domain-containing protein [Anaerolineae bacterium]
MAKKQLVLAFFENEAAADNAVEMVKAWDKASKDVKLGSIGVLVKDDKGKIKTRKLGKRHTGTGIILGALAGVLIPGVSFIGGAIIGGVVGAFYRKGLRLSKDDVARIDGELSDGKAAVGVLANPEAVEALTTRLAELGGKTETHEVTDGALDQAEAAADSSGEEVVAEVDEVAEKVEPVAAEVEAVAEKVEPVAEKVGEVAEEAAG